MDSVYCFNKFGDPFTKGDEGKYMVMWDVPAHLEIGVIPKKIYCNKAMIGPLTKAFTFLIERNYVNELKTWDGCFNIRAIRGYEKKYVTAMKAKNYNLAATYLSIHSWGGAFDINATWNGLGRTPTLSPGFVKCFTDAGFDWGGYFRRKDGMHFQLKTM